MWLGIWTTTNASTIENSPEYEQLYEELGHKTSKAGLCSKDLIDASQTLKLVLNVWPIWIYVHLSAKTTQNISLVFLRISLRNFTQQTVPLHSPAAWEDTHQWTWTKAHSIPARTTFCNKGGDTSREARTVIWKKTNSKLSNRTVSNVLEKNMAWIASSWRRWK